MERKLASIRKIDEILPIQGADRIELARIGGWKVITGKGNFKTGDEIIYFEIDSFIRLDNNKLKDYIDENMIKRCKKVFNQQEGILIKTMKMRGEYSQGFILPNFLNAKLDEDLTEILEVQKYELPQPQVQNAKGNFPNFIRKTDCERIQNLKYIPNCRYEITIKYDGTSFTAYRFNDLKGVCSRNLELKLDDSNIYTDIYKKYNIEKKLEKYGRNIAIQGEIIGPNVQNNPMKLNTLELKIFSIWDIDKQEYLSPVERIEICKNLDLPIASIAPIGQMMTPWELMNESEDFYNSEGFTKKFQTYMLNYVETKNPDMEGYVLKSSDGKNIIKVINNSYI